MIQLTNFGLNVIASLNCIVSTYLGVAENIASRNIPMTTDDYVKILDAFLKQLIMRFCKSLRVYLQKQKKRMRK